MKKIDLEKIEDTLLKNANMQGSIGSWDEMDKLLSAPLAKKNTINWKSILGLILAICVVSVAAYMFLQEGDVERLETEEDLVQERNVLEKIEEKQIENVLPLMPKTTLDEAKSPIKLKGTSDILEVSSTPTKQIPVYKTTDFSNRPVKKVASAFIKKEESQKVSSAKQDSSQSRDTLLANSIPKTDVKVLSDSTTNIKNNSLLPDSTSTENRIYLGVSIGMNIGKDYYKDPHSASGNPYFDDGRFSSMGVYANMKLKKDWMLEGGLFYTHFNISELKYTDISGSTNQRTSKIVSIYNLAYLSIPVKVVKPLFTYKKSKLAVTLGVSPSFHLSSYGWRSVSIDSIRGTSSETAAIGRGDGKNEPLLKQMINPFDMGVGLGLQYYLGSNWQLEGTYTQGVLDYSNNSVMGNSIKSYNSNIIVSVKRNIIKLKK